TSTPSRTYLAIVAAPLLDSSSGWACTAMRRSGPSPTGAPWATSVAGLTADIRNVPLGGSKQHCDEGNTSSQHPQPRSAFRLPGSESDPLWADCGTYASAESLLERTFTRRHRIFSRSKPASASSPTSKPREIFPKYTDFISNVCSS